MLEFFASAEWLTIGTYLPTSLQSLYQISTPDALRTYLQLQMILEYYHSPDGPRALHPGWRQTPMECLVTFSLIDTDREDEWVCDKLHTYSPETVMSLVTRAMRYRHPYTLHVDTRTPLAFIATRQPTRSHTPFV